MTLPDCSAPDGADPCRGYHELKNDLNETLKAVLHFWGPEGAHKVTSHVLMARKAKASNDEIDKLEKIFGSVE